MIDAKDIGYKFTKSCYSRGSSPDITQSDLFPTAVSKYLPTSAFGEAPVVIRVNGVSFAVGDTAVREGKIINTRRKDFVGSAPYLAVLGYALERSACMPKVLVLGLPPGQFTEKNTESLTRLLHNTDITDSKGSRIRIPGIIKWVPQGAGIYFAHIRNGNIYDHQRNIVVLDNGYYTFDQLFFRKGKYVKGAAKSHPLGVFEIYEQIQKKFYEVHKVFLKSDESCDKLIVEGKVEIAGTEYILDVNDIVDLYNSQIVSLTEEYMQNLPGEVDGIVAGGGGIKLIRQEEIVRLRIKITQGAQLANARGYFEYGKSFV